MLVDSKRANSDVVILGLKAVQTQTDTIGLLETTNCRWKYEQRYDPTSCSQQNKKETVMAMIMIRKEFSTSQDGIIRFPTCRNAAVTTAAASLIIQVTQDSFHKAHFICLFAGLSDHPTQLFRMHHHHYHPVVWEVKLPSSPCFL